jgi:hypothetical protein
MKKKMTPVAKGHTPKTAQGKAAVKRLGRTKATGNFEAIESAAAKKYRSKTIGQKIAGAIYWKKTKARLFKK